MSMYDELETEYFHGEQGHIAALPRTCKGMCDEELLHALNTLLEATQDAHYNFALAAKYAKAQDLKNRLLRRAREAAEASQDLYDLIMHLGGAPSDGGTAAGTLYRGWILVRATLGCNSDEAMLQECQRSEDAEMTAYLKAMAMHLPPDVCNIVECHAHAALCSWDEAIALQKAVLR